MAGDDFFQRQFATGQGALGSMGAGGGEGSYKSVPGYATWLMTGGAVKLHDIKNFGIADKTPWTEQKIAGPLASLVNSQKPNFVEKAMAQAYEDIAKNAKSVTTGGSDSREIAPPPASWTARVSRESADNAPSLS